MWISTIYSAIFLYNILSIGCGEPDIFTIVPTNQYVWINQTATFTCATNVNEYTLSWSIISADNNITHHSPPPTNLSEGGWLATCSFIVTSDNNGTSVRCYAEDGNGLLDTDEAFAYAQDPSVGNLIAKQQDQCSTCILIEWKTPYLLPGLSILLYKVYIDGKMIQDNISGTNHTYCPMKLTNSTYNVAVEPFNDNITGDAAVESVTFEVLPLNISVYEESPSNWTILVEPIDNCQSVKNAAIAYCILDDNDKQTNICINGSTKNGRVEINGKNQLLMRGLEISSNVCLDITVTITYVTKQVLKYSECKCTYASGTSLLLSVTLTTSITPATPIITTPTSITPATPIITTPTSITPTTPITTTPSNVGLGLGIVLGSIGIVIGIGIVVVVVIVILIVIVIKKYTKKQKRNNETELETIYPKEDWDEGSRRDSNGLASTTRPGDTATQQHTTTMIH